MLYTQHIFFSDEILPKDDIDKLFEKLEQLEPPTTLIENILKLAIKPPPAPALPQPNLIRYPLILGHSWITS